jgi:hypothetical protein
MSRLKDLHDSATSEILPSEPVLREMMLTCIKESTEVIAEKNRANGREVLKLTEHNKKARLSHLCNDLAIQGKGLDKPALATMIQIIVDGRGEENALISHHVVGRLMKEFNLKARNVDNLDPARVRASTPENRDVNFQRMENLVRLLHTLYPTKCPWKTWAEVPAKCKHNMDEAGSDTSKLRTMILQMEVSRKKAPAEATTPEGDRMNRHVTSCVTT